jgi:hypothetical protein
VNMNFEQNKAVKKNWNESSGTDAEHDAVHARAQSEHAVTMAEFDSWRVRFGCDRV